MGVETALQELGGDRETLMERGAIIGLNLVRKAVMAWKKERNVA